MNAEYLIPRNLRENDSRKLFTLVGLNRESRRASKLNDVDLASLVLDPETRLWMFWCKWWPELEGKANWLSVDLRALLEFCPTLRTRVLPESQGALDLEQFQIREDLIGQKIPTDMRHLFAYSPRPLSIWPELKANVQTWDSLAEPDRIKTVNALFALDGISGSTAFTSGAVALTPQCRDYFESMSMMMNWESEETAQPEGGVKLAREDALEGWKARWRELASTARRGEAGLISRSLVDQARLSLVDLEKLIEAAPPDAFEVDPSIDAVTGAVTEFCEVLRQIGVEPPNDAWRKEFIDAVLAGMGREIDAEALEGFARDLRGKSAVVHEHELARRDLIAQLSKVEEDLKEVAVGGRIPLFRQRNDLSIKKGDLDISVDEALTEIWSLIDEFRACLGLEEQVTKAVPTNTEKEAGQDPVADPSPEMHVPDEAPGSSVPTTKEQTPSATEELTETPPGLSTGGAAAEKLVGPIISSDLTPILVDGGAGRISIPAGVGESEETRANDAFSEAAGERCAPIWGALRGGKVALAYQITRALSELEPECPIPPLPLMKALALASHVQDSHGEVARDLAAAYESIDASSFEAGPSEWREALSILLVAATVRPGLVAPATGATAVATYAHPPQKTHELRRMVAEAGNRLQGMNLGQAAFRQVGGMAEWEQEWKNYREEMNDWKHGASHFQIKFGRAQDVWRHLLSPHGQIGQLLALIETPDPAQGQAVAGLVLQLSESELRRTINHIDRHVFKARGQDIQAAALKRLQEETAAALEFAQRWTDLQGRFPREDNFVVRTLDEFRHSYRSLRQDLERELDELAISGSRWQLIASAVVCLRIVLVDLDALLAGAGDTPDRPLSGARLLGLPLLQTVSLDVDENWQPMQSADVVRQATVEIVHRKLDWPNVFAARLARGDINGCREIAAELDALGDDHAEQCRRQLDQAIQSARTRLTVRLKEARRELESALAYGYIEEPERGNRDAELATVEGRLEDASQFSDAQVVIDRTVVDLRAHKAARLGEVRLELSEVERDAAPEVITRIRDVIERGDVFTAHEYLQAVRAGDPLPATATVKPDAFQVFFPDSAGRIEVMLGGETADPKSIRTALLDGRDLACLQFSAVTREQRETARPMLDAWYALKRTSAGNATLANMTDVVAGLGFTGAKLTLRARSRDKLECDLSCEVIGDRSICPVASYGSQAKGSYRAIFLWGTLSEEDFPRAVGDIHGGSATLAIYLGTLREKQRRELARITRSMGASFLVLDEILMLHLCAEPGSRLGAFFACALPFSTVKPFVTTSGLVPPEMFFGRTEQLRAVTDRNGRCFVYGGRQLGKTALLRAAERSFHQPERRQYAAWIDLKAVGIGSAVEVGNIWSAIYRKLLELDRARFGDLPDPGGGRRQLDLFLEATKRKFAPDGGTRLLLLLDEADSFLEADGKSLTQYLETGRLKNLMDTSDRGFKVVFAGLHNVLRTAEQPNHPLAHFGDPIEIGPFTGASEWSEARNMIRGPLLSAGYQLATDDLVVRILAQTNYYPVLIQLYGEQLLRILHDPNRLRFDVAAGPRYSIGDSLVDEAYRERSLRDAIRARFHYTLQLDQRYEVITYALAWALNDRETTFAQGASATELRDWSASSWSEGFRGVSDHEFRIILDEMVGLGVLRHVGDHAYSLRNPNLLRLLGTVEDIYAVLTRMREAPVEFEPSVFYAPDPDDPAGPRRSPLTLSQEGTLLADRHGVSLISGSSAGGLNELEYFLKRRVPKVQWLRNVTNRNEFGKLLDARRDEGNTVLLVPSDVAWSDSWIRQALDKVRKLTSQDRLLRVVFVADPMAVWQLTPVLPELETLRVEILPLRPWTDAFLRQWLEDMHIIGGDDSGLREELRKATGFWPAALIPLPAPCHRLEDLIGLIKRRFEVPNNRERFLTDLGLPSGEARACMRLLQDLPDEPLENLIGLAPDSLAPESLHRRMLWAERLQFVQKTGKDTWRLEPFLDSLLSAQADA